jgi:uncharacterized caspase-like protein
VKGRPHDFKIVRDRDNEVKAEVTADLEAYVQNPVTVDVKNTGASPLKLIVHVDYKVDSSFLPKLHVFAVGVAEYQAKENRLDYADKDAEDLAASFKDLKGLLYREVRTTVLTNRNATRRHILDQLEIFMNPDEIGLHDLVLVFISGHGIKGRGDRFYFLPHDYDPNAPARSATAISWDNILESLEKVRCHVLVVADTCHSGQIARGIKGGTPEELQEEIRKKLESSMKNSKGIVVMAACLADEKARENSQGKHGNLTLAFLEGIQEERLVPRKDDDVALPWERGLRVISLRDLASYVEKRVGQLGNGEQAPVTKSQKDIALQRIPISCMQKKRR